MLHKFRVFVPIRCDKSHQVKSSSSQGIVFDRTMRTKTVTRLTSFVLRMHNGTLLSVLAISVQRYRCEILFVICPIQFVQHETRYWSRFADLWPF